MILLILYYVYKWITVPWSYYESTRSHRRQCNTKPWIETELKRHECVALFWIVISPFLAGYTLQLGRYLLSNYDKYMSSFNVTIFIIAATIKPLLHITQLLKQRTLYLNSLIDTDPSAIDIIQAKLQLLQNELDNLKHNTRRDFTQITKALSPTIHQLSTNLKQIKAQQLELKDWSEHQFLDIDEKLKEYKRGLVESVIFLPVDLSIGIAKMVGLVNMNKREQFLPSNK
ncbi:uncharacterized protein BX663DRAFT_442862 [Cokeromyces recurvatus]|uniref:uncharacterized protein n=1 Tax=Cokeromyces recurvatus TaxID=90255 RepID=UPI00221F181E|nr:uncharacterized protein BX663DRAFT_442862 [Cokeromyces recurvatus]KAI7898538.1 hypothetical protein BX663DRAFT_442862 [Cokeromyces recurvatus]